MDAVITPKKYKLEDLKIGMEVNKDQLTDIYDTWIILTPPSNRERDGVIRFIGHELNEKSDEIRESPEKNIIVYNDSMDLDGDIYYAE